MDLKKEKLREIIKKLIGEEVVGVGGFVLFKVLKRSRAVERGGK